MVLQRVSGYGLAISYFLYNAELNKIVEAKAPVKRYDIIQPSYGGKFRHRTGAVSSSQAKCKLGISRWCYACVFVVNFISIFFNDISSCYDVAMCDLGYCTMWRLYIAYVDCKQYEPCHEETNILVSDLVLHKPGCTATEDS